MIILNTIGRFKVQILKNEKGQETRDNNESRSAWWCKRRVAKHAQIK